MRLSVQRRLGLPLDVACQAAAAGKKTRNKKIQYEFGDAAVNVPQQSHNTRHKCVLQRLILALRAAWGTAVRMEPKKATSVRVITNNPTWTRATLAGAASAFQAMSSLSAPSPAAGSMDGRKGAFVAFGNTEAFYRNMVVGHGPYCEEGEGPVRTSS